MLHDAARKGDVEIPVFCYEPKLGDPVGACRMCLVEIEGIPKLQTSCSTPVRDGMVVHTRTEQVKHAQSAVVEFLLVNHPLDCPVCDKGGECPLQDITQGWGPGKSRVIDEKRHFEKPIELSPLVAIDRERCILCYRCVRFSQEVSEDAQLQLLERGDRTFVGTFDDRPYVAPFHGNITELCPVGALTNYTYRFRARPWDIEQAGSVCTLCPSQCNVSFTVRDEKVKRVLGRDNAEVDDGWLCDRGRYGFEMFGDEERVDRAAAQRRRRERLGDGDRKAAAGPAQGRRRKVAAIVGDASNEEGYLVQRLLREALGSPHIDSRPSRGPGREAMVRLAQPEPRGAGARHRRRRRDPRPRHRPPAQLADPRPPHPQGDPPQRRHGWPSPPSARPRSTAAPRRSPATPPARPPTSSPSWRRPPAAPRTSPRRWPRACATPARYPDRRSASIPALWAVQERYGWCTPKGVRQAAAVIRVKPGYLESVASFYDLLHTDPVGSHRIEVCTNISCWMRGGDQLLDAFVAAAEGDEDLFVTGFECLGACDIAPMASIDQRYYGPLEVAEAGVAIEQLKAGAEVLPEKDQAKRPLAGDTANPGGPNA